MSTSYSQSPTPPPPLPPRTGPPMSQADGYGSSPGPSLILPSLPPRPSSGAGPFSSSTSRDFPPPPRSPNRPPALPPRPQGYFPPPPSQAQAPYSTPHLSPCALSTPSVPPPTAGQALPPLPRQTVQTQPPPPYASLDFLPPAPPPGPPPRLAPPTQTSVASVAESLPLSYSRPSPAAWPTLQPLQPNQTSPPSLTEPTLGERDTAQCVSPSMPAHERPAVQRPTDACPVTSDMPSGQVQVMNALMEALCVAPNSSAHTPEHTPPKNAPARPLGDSTPRLQLSAGKSVEQSSNIGSPTEPPAAVIACINTPMSFGTCWYAHVQAPDVLVCSRCYIDHLWPTPLRDIFTSRFLDDGTARRCRFGVPHVTQRLLPDAIARWPSPGALDALLSHLSRRTRDIADCPGLVGAAGRDGHVWFRVRDNAVRGLLICTACMEDVVAAAPEALSARFEPLPTTPAPYDKLTCAMALPYVRRQFDAIAGLESVAVPSRNHHHRHSVALRRGDWDGFAVEAKARLDMPPCPQNRDVVMALRAWFVPKAGRGPADAVLCMACYCDYIHGDNDAASQWQTMQQRADPAYAQASTSRCIMGRFSLRIAMLAAVSDAPPGDWANWWRALAAVAHAAPPCDANSGMPGATWFTLRTQPTGFAVCGACHTAIIASIGLTRFFVPQSLAAAAETAMALGGPDTGAASTPRICALNPEAPRFGEHVTYLFTTMFMQDATLWMTFAARYGAVPPCPRDVDMRGRTWFGWPDCVICAACYVDVVKGSSLDVPGGMPMRTPTVLADAHVCALYSPRMRTLFARACARVPPDATELRAAAVERTRVYWQTMPACRTALARQMQRVNEASMARIQGTFYTTLGNMEEMTMSHHRYTYGQAGVGYGFDNINQLDGARYNAQASDMTAQLMGGNTAAIGLLERQWRAVE